MKSMKLAGLLLILSPLFGSALASVGSKEAQVMAVADGFFAAWNKHNGKAIGQAYSSDADFINVIGMHWKGREEIVNEHVKLHAGRMKNTRLEKVGSKVSFLSDDVALAIVQWHLTGDTGAPGWKSTDDRNGILSYVLKKKDGKWSIVFTQNTDIVPIPNN